MKKRNYLILFGVVLLVSAGYFLAYLPVSWHDDNPLPAAQTKLLAHKGCGSTGKSGTGPTENSMDGAKLGLSLLDGIELDIHMSASGTLYCSHSKHIKECQGQPEVKIINLTDREIKEKLSGCNQQLQPLEPILDLLAKNPKKYLHLDIKGHYFVGSLSYNGYMEEVASKVAMLCKEKGVSSQVIAESDCIPFHQKVKRLNPSIQCYIAVFNWGNRSASLALSNELDGLSLKNTPSLITKDNLDLYRKKGLKIVAWTINDHSEILRVSKLGADFIITDKVDSETKKWWAQQ